jgi:hypothetical protein
LQTRAARLQDEVLVADDRLDLTARHIDQGFVVVSLQRRAHPFGVLYLQRGGRAHNQWFCA